MLPVRLNCTTFVKTDVINNYFIHSIIIMRRFLLLIGAMLTVASAFAATGVREEFKANVRLSANNYQAYPDKNLPMLTPAPQGYEPFYINHYGRHGSRWLISKGQYGFPIAQLEKAEKAGKLTARGKQVLDTLRMVRTASTLRLGELSDIGAEQHQGIAARMMRNFPQVFKGNAPVDAKSTIIIRCILSMQNETDILKSLNPELRITTDASEHDMYYMNYSDSVIKPLRKSVEHLYQKLGDKLINTKHVYKVLFTDQKWANSNIDGRELMIKLFDVAANMQSHHQFENVNFYNVFSDDDIYNIWQYNNARWYLLSGETPLTRCRMDYNQANLLRNFIDAADKGIALGRNSATLRFGHESVLLPLVCLMGINGADYHTTDLETLADHWQAYKIYPMGANLQMIYYRKPGNSDVLVKVLLNEHEATLPVKTDVAPYYHWSDVRAYFIDKLSQQPKP